MTWWDFLIALWEDPEAAAAKLTALAVLAGLAWRYLGRVARAIWGATERVHSPGRVWRRRYRELDAELTAVQEELHRIRLSGDVHREKARARFLETRVASLSACRDALTDQLKKHGHGPVC